jgi:methylmalonyl-CoA/ethylmalonyl-CoA epimerase
MVTAAVPDNAEVSSAPAAPVTVLDHVAIATRALTDGWQLFGRLLGGRWAYGGDSPGFWWGQLKFAAGAKVELLTPTGGPDAAFLERFLTGRDAGPHHFNFIVPDIVESLERVRAVGIDPVQVNLDDPNWKEAFLHPKTAHGIVVQLAQQASEPVAIPPADLPSPGPAARFVTIEHHVDDLDGATRLFGEALDGQHVSDENTTSDSVLLQWTNGARLRLLGPSAQPHGAAGPGLQHLHFERAETAITAAEHEEINSLATRLGVSVQAR